MSLPSLVLLLLLVFSAAQDDCQCDDVVAIALNNAFKEEATLATSLSTIESQISLTQEELKGCQVKVTETKEQFEASEAELKIQIEVLEKEKTDLEVTAGKLELVEHELHEAREEMNHAASQAEGVEHQLKQQMDEERGELQSAEKALVEAHKELEEAKGKMKIIKELKSKSYFNFGAMWGDLVASVSGAKEEDL